MAAVPSVGTGTWTFVGSSGTATITSANSPTTTITSVPFDQDITLRWTETNCSLNSSDDVVIHNDAQPSVSNQSDQEQCNTSTFTMTQSTPSVGTGLWTVISGSATFTDANSPTTNVSVTSSPATVRWTVTNGTCNAFDNVILTNYAQPIADAGNGGNECDLNFVLNAVPSAGTGVWTKTAGSGTASFSPNANASNATVTVTQYGTYTFRWTETNGTCSPSFDEVIVNFYEQPVVSDQPNQTLCNTSTFTMTQSSPSPGTGLWTVQSGTATITDNTSPTTTITGVAAGSTATVRWTVTNGTCSAFDDVVLTNSQAVTVANAGTDQTQCNNGSFTLAGNSPSVGSGTWTVESGTATITTPTSATSGVTGVPAGTTAVLRWTIVNGACSSFDEVSLTNSQAVTVANAGTDQTQCNNGSFTLAGNSPSVGSGTWTVESGTATITNSASATSTVTGVPAGTTAVLRWTIVNGACSSFDDVSLTNDAQPSVSDQGNQTQCDNGSFTMTQSTPSVGTGLWTLVSGSATITNASSPTTTVTGVAAGSSATVRWTVTNGTCSAFDEVVITNSQAVTVANAGADQTQCNTSSFTLAGNSPSVGVGTWTVQSGTATITTPSSATSGVTGVSAGTTAVLGWTIVNGACSSFDEVSLTNSEAVTPANAGPDQAQCNSGSFTLAGNSPSVGTGTWTLQSGTATITNSASATSTVTGVPAGTTAVLRWTIVNGACSSFDDVTLTNDAQPSVSDQGNQTQCDNGSFAMTQSTPSVGTGLWTLVSGSATITNASSPTTTVTGVAAGSSATVRWTVTNGTCSAFDEVVITNSQAVTVANAGADQTQCNTSSFTLAGNSPSVGVGTWTVQSGTATITTPSSATSGVTGVPAGTTAVLGWTIVNGACSSFDEVSLTNSEAVTPANAGPDQAQCNSGSFTLAGNSPSVGTGTWTLQSGTATITNSASATSTVTGVPAGTTAVLRWTIV